MPAKSTICCVVLIQVNWKVSILFHQPTKKIIVVMIWVSFTVQFTQALLFSDQKIKLIFKMYKDTCMQYCTYFCKVWSCLILERFHVTLEYFTNLLLFVILVPLKIIECLGSANHTFIIKEKQSLTATCIYSGIPVPQLTCTLLDANNHILSTTSPKIVRTNFTKTNPMILPNVGKTATSVKCFIYSYGKSTHTATRKVVVHGM